MSTLSICLIAFYVINILMTISVLFLERKETRQALLWIFAFFAIPVVPWILYFFIGKGPKLNRRNWAKRKAISDENIRKQAILGNINHYIGDDDEERQMISLNENNGFFCTTYNETKIYCDAHEMYKDQIEDIKNAKKSINVLYYIFRTDKVGRYFLDVLTEKAKEGVEVILVFDDSANPKMTYRFLKKFINAGGKVQPFFPSRLTRIGHNFAYRNHRKIVVIDGVIGYIGGMNIGKEYLSMHKKIKPWRDTHLRIVGEAVCLLQIRFFQDLSGAKPYYSKKKRTTGFEEVFAKNMVTFPSFDKENVSPIQIVSSGPDSLKEEIKLAYLKMIGLAKKSLVLQTPYFIPDKGFIDALIVSKHSGVDVKLVIPGVPDKKVVYHVTYSYLEEILKAGIEVYLYPGFLHSKMIVIDESVTSIGTANLDERSFSWNFEVNAFIYDKEFSKEAMIIAKNDIEKSRLLTFEDYKKRPIKDKFLENLFRLFSPLM